MLLSVAQGKPVLFAFHYIKEYFCFFPGRSLHKQRSHKSSGSETSDEDSESRRTSRSSLSTVVLNSLSRHRRDSGEDPDDGGGGGGRGWGNRKNSGMEDQGNNNNTVRKSDTSSSDCVKENNDNYKQGKMEESELSWSNNNQAEQCDNTSEPKNVKNFNNSSCAELPQNRCVLRCVTPNNANNVLNNMKSGGKQITGEARFVCNQICNVLEKRSKSAESSRSSKSSQTSSARSSSSSLSISTMRGRLLSSHRTRRNSRSTMSDTGLVLRWNNLRRAGKATSSSSSSVASLAVTVPAGSRLKLLRRPRSEGNVANSSVLTTGIQKRQSRSTSLPRPCPRYVRNNLNNARAASCGPYISNGMSRKRQCLTTPSTPIISLQPCIPESQMATIEPGLCLHLHQCYTSHESKESNLKRSNISLASSTCSASKYAVDPINELVPSPTNESRPSSAAGSLSRHGNNMQMFKSGNKRGSISSSQENFGLEEKSPVSKGGHSPSAKSRRMKISFLSYVSGDAIFKRRPGSKTSPTVNSRNSKWTESYSKSKSLPGAHSSCRNLHSDSCEADNSMVIRKTKPDCCIIM